MERPLQRYLHVVLKICAEILPQNPLFNSFAELLLTPSTFRFFLLGKHIFNTWTHFVAQDTLHLTLFHGQQPICHLWHIFLSYFAHILTHFELLANGIFSLPMRFLSRSATSKHPGTGTHTECLQNISRRSLEILKHARILDRMQKGHGCGHSDGFGHGQRHKS